VNCSKIKTTKFFTLIIQNLHSKKKLRTLAWINCDGQKKIVEKGKRAGNITILEKRKEIERGFFSNGCTLV
jgi:hypothetical protein